MDVGSVLLDILVVLIAAKLAAENAERINVPAVVGQLVAGVIIGPSILGFLGWNETLSVLGALGVSLLLLGVGMEQDVADLSATVPPEHWLRSRSPSPSALPSSPTPRSLHRSSAHSSPASRSPGAARRNGSSASSRRSVTCSSRCSSSRSGSARVSRRSSSPR